MQTISYFSLVKVLTHIQLSQFDSKHTGRFNLAIKDNLLLLINCLQTINILRIFYPTPDAYPGDSQKEPLTLLELEPETHKVSTKCFTPMGF
jgi:hypothetical protein